jgi:hypothetical protein
MFILKCVVYTVTIVVAMFFAFWELRLKRQLTDGVSSWSGKISEFGVMHDLSERMERERALRALPKAALGKLRIVIRLKFLFVALLIIEVIVLQRTK